MIEPLIPADEKERLAALEQLCILDTPSEERFDRITRTACDLFQVPIALISLVDSHRQWFKSKAGLAAIETPREISFCGHAILGADPFVVENALLDPRFADNPLVTDDPKIRFYAGMPLLSYSGKRLGTLCLIDREPRHFDNADTRRLRDLAAWVERELNFSVNIESAVAEMRETFVRLVSHELRTPVTGMVGALGLLGNVGSAGGEIDTIVRLAADSAERLRSVVDDIVEIAELDAGQIDLKPHRIDLPLFIEALKHSNVEKAQKINVAVVVQSPPNLFVEVAPRPLTRILNTILDNALRFAPPETLVVIAATQARPNWIRITVTDQGPGIPVEHIPRLFQPFAQADSTDSRSHNGRGISLATSYRLAIAIRGHLGYEPAEVGGARFFLDIPG